VINDLRNSTFFTVHTIRWALVSGALLVWQWAGSSSDQAHFFYSTPTEVVARVIHEFEVGTLFADTRVTCEEVLLGSLSGLLIGFVFGLAFWWFKPLGLAAQPLIIGLASIPVFAVAPLLVFWFGVDLVGKIVVVGLSIVFICLLATYQAANQIEEDYRELARCVDASRFDIFRGLVLKGSLFMSIPSYRLALIFGFIGAFIAEVISSNKGLGHFIQRSSGLYDVTGILAGLAVFIICSLMLVLALERLDKRFAIWR
jgi:NitT/TauT family transport system permease protein